MEAGASGMNSQSLFIGAALACAGLYLVYRTVTTKPTASKVINKDEWREFPLIKRVEINHNTRLFRMGLPNATDVLGLPPGQHISIRGECGGKMQQRSYTPVSQDEDQGHFDVIIKVYPQGNISQYMDKLKVGDPVSVKGPKGKFIYQPGMAKQIGMIAGGTGITPMLQVARYIMKDPKDKTQVSLIFANVNEEDILLREELDALAAKEERFSVYYVLNNPPANWTQGTGFVNPTHIQQQLPAPGKDTLVLACGPPPMVKAMRGHLEGLGHEAEHMFMF